ncbi:MmcQ/YjbR family DNA-binding protein [Bacillus sp. Marseille-Q3570]|uniref:MmcQ/YjbR family DNA-binding protein n=1 Tax=Bacillus sp. Marseille-Q3570 TaxID=2963522 RepID=UPI0021B76A6C|nr:MmcQ/YjbR family DNA-binding protein [Bacillus sp. Marseille-Q3570]
MGVTYNELYETIKAISTRFPQVEEHVDGFGHTSFRVKDKPFVILGEDKEHPSLSIKTLKSTQELLIQQPGYRKSAYIGQHGWTTFPLEELDWDEVADYILEAYYRTAPKKLHEQVQINRK